MLENVVKRSEFVYTREQCYKKKLSIIINIVEYARVSAPPPPPPPPPPTPQHPDNRDRQMKPKFATKLRKKRINFINVFQYVHAPLTFDLDLVLE